MLRVREHHMQQRRPRCSGRKCRMQSVLRDSVAGLLLSSSCLARFCRYARGVDIAAHVSVRKYALESAMASVVGLTVVVFVNVVLLVILNVVRRTLMLMRRPRLRQRQRSNAAVFSCCYGSIAATSNVLECPAVQTQN